MKTKKILSLVLSLAMRLCAASALADVAFLVTRTNLKYIKFVSAVFTFPYIMPSWTLALFWETFFKNVNIGLKTSNGIMASVFGVYMPEWFVYGAFPIALVIVLLLVAVVPLVTFAMESLIIKAGDYRPSNMTLDFWIGTNLAERLDQGDSTGILLNPRVWSALGYSLALAVISAFVAGTCGILAGYGIAKRRGSRLANMVNSLSFFPYLMPSLAFGAIYLAMSAKLPWLHGFLLLALVGSVKYLPFASRSGLNAMLQLSGEIEEAAVINGVPWWKRCWACCRSSSLKAAVPTSSPAASSSAWPLRGPWRPRPRCCSWTNR